MMSTQWLNQCAVGDALASMFMNDGHTRRSAIIMADQATAKFEPDVYEAPHHHVVICPRIINNRPAYEIHIVVGDVTYITDMQLPPVRSSARLAAK